MNVNTKRFVKCIALILPAVLLLMLIPYNNKAETLRVRGFYKEPENTLDVVMLGSSDVFNAHAPGLAYAEYGYTSYNYCISQNFVDLFKYQINEILSTQSPQVIVVDISGILYVSRNHRYDSIFRTYVEGVPLSWNKLRMVREFEYQKEPLSYYIPFIMYHGDVSLRDMWVTLGNEKCLWENGALLKGATTGSQDHYQGNARDISQDHSSLPLGEDTERKLRDLLDHCQQIQDTKFLFIVNPHRVVVDIAYQRLQQSNTAGRIIQDYGFDFVNMEYLVDDIGLDFYTDYYDDDHMTIYGQKKYTRYMGKLLTEKYGVTGRPQAPENLARWEDTVKYTKLLYAYYEKRLEDDPGSSNLMMEEAWLISELNWIAQKLEKDGLPLTFDSTYAK